MDDGSVCSDPRGEFGTMVVGAAPASFLIEGSPLVAEAIDIRSQAKELNVQIVFEGTVRQDNNVLRITSRVIAPADGIQIWSERIETEPDLEGLSGVSERIAASLLGRIRPWSIVKSRE